MTNNSQNKKSTFYEVPFLFNEIFIVQRPLQALSIMALKVALGRMAAVVFTGSGLK